ncbi:TerB family tellurite resistance protein [Tardiphaga sp. 37S4]|uniref:tellurite resistance TerB family protein n=1 Tax=unclassified Tardiphaga TaxID=2631404 RepID=UPI001E33FB43|nr:TerB family tellurite resistance protein [Tardiphaga sp. 37S4]UFS75573.1 TerB family tellurite resistance protein [Tardiphaga sp. 37S4]
MAGRKSAVVVVSEENGRVMFGSIKAFISRAMEDANQRKNVEQRELLIVTAALLIRVATVDSELSDIRRVRLHAIFRSHYGLDDAATVQLLVDADAVARSAVDLYRFTRQLNEFLDDDGRRRIVQLMWETVYADQRVNEFEENLIWRAADLLGVSSRQRVELRQHVVARIKNLAAMSA